MDPLLVRGVRGPSRSLGRALSWLCLVLSLLVALGGCHGESQPPVPRAAGGALDLDGWSFASDGPIALDGEWEWFWGQLLTPAEAGRPSGTFTLPRAWNGQILDGKVLGGAGYATFRLHVRLSQPAQYGLLLRFCSNAYRLWWNDFELDRSGVVGRSRSESAAGCHTRAPTFYAPAGENVLTLQISNYHHMRGGLRSSMQLGLADQILPMHDQLVVRDAFLLGGLVLVMLYNLTNYLLRRQERTQLYLALACGLIALWLGMQGPLVVTVLLPSASWATLLRLEYVGLYLAPVAAGLLANSLFPGEVPRWMFDIFHVHFAGMALAVLLTPPWMFTRTLSLFTFLITLYALLCIGIAARAVLHRRPQAAVSFLGFLPLWLGVARDAIFSLSAQGYEIITPLGVMFLVLVQALMMARRAARAYATVEEQAHRLHLLNLAYDRFVPKEFLRLLGKEDIRAVQLGDQVAREMTVLFADVRGFTSLSETMSPQENFAFVNLLLGRVGPLIRQHRGFIDKYLGDGIMALFPRHPGDALGAAREIRDALAHLNQQREARGERPVRIGIGIHTGGIMLGTVGEPARMDGTVISDVVNTASRLESLTKAYGATVLVSEQVLRTLRPELVEYTRMLGRVRAKGKLQPITVFEFWGGDPDDQAQLKRQTRDDFQTALLLFGRADFNDAARRFAAVLDRNPADTAARYYLGRAQRLLEQGRPADWDGVEVITEK